MKNIIFSSILFFIILITKVSSEGLVVNNLPKETIVVDGYEITLLEQQAFLLKIKEPNVSLEDLGFIHLNKECTDDLLINPFLDRDNERLTYIVFTLYPCDFSEKFQGLIFLLSNQEVVYISREDIFN